MVATPQFETVEGSPGLILDEAAHIFIPGRGRDATGMDVSRLTRARLDVAAVLYHEWEDERDDGFTGYVVPSGYKTPADANGVDRYLHDEINDRNRLYRGVPEAYSGQLYLQTRGVPRVRIHPEINSIDTVTNFVRSEQEGHFGTADTGKPDERPVAIVAQASHLERMIEVIAPRTLRRDYIGVIVPETGEPDIDSRQARLFSQVVAFGLRPNSHLAALAVPRTHLSAQVLWGGLLAAQHLRRQKTTFYTES